MKIARLFVIAMLALAAMPAAVAFAQYPEPLGVCTVTPNQASVAPNSVATFTVTTRTASGAPLAGQSGTVSVASGNATVLTPTFTTGAGGTAQVSVQTGANPGNVTLNVTCGALQATGVVSVSTPAAQPKPPDTGLGTMESSNSTMPLLLMIAGIALAGAAGTAGATVLVRRK
jgi:hypothetical protein